MGHHDDGRRTLSIISTPERKFLSTAYSSRLIGRDSVLFGLRPLLLARRTLPRVAPIDSALRSLLALRVSMARNAAAVPLLVALSSPTAWPVVFDLLCLIPIAAGVVHPHRPHQLPLPHSCWVHPERIDLYPIFPTSRRSVVNDPNYISIFGGLSVMKCRQHVYGKHDTMVYRSFNSFWHKRYIGLGALGLQYVGKETTDWW